jgi:uncharacterized protein (DUF58 family)
MVPSRRLVLLFLIPLVVGLAAVFRKELVTAMIVVDATIVVAAAFDAWLARGKLIAVRREMPEVFSLGRKNPVRLSLRSRANRRLELLVRDDVFVSAETTDLPVHVELAPRSVTTEAYHVEPKHRGAFEIGAHTVRYPSPLGLWFRQYSIDAKDEIKVYPDLLRIRAYELLAKRDREFALNKAVRMQGGESEFERLRDYSTDDEYRSIDWKATARRDHLIARQYQLESNQNLVFMLDAGRLMTARTGGLSQFDHGLNASLMLSHIAARGGDRVGLVGFDEAVRRYVPPSTGRRAVDRMIRATYDLHPKLVESDYDAAFDQVSQRLRKRSLIVLFTQIADESSAQLVHRRVRALIKRHLPLVVLFRDPEFEELVEGHAPDARALYTRGAAAELLRWRDGVARQLSSTGAHVLQPAPGELTTSVINSYLRIKARNLL